MDTTTIFIQWETEDDKDVSGIWVKDIESDPNYLIFGWPLDASITKTPGPIKFSVRFIQRNDDGESEYTATDMVNEDGENEYTFVNTFMPNVERRETISSVIQSNRKKVHKTKIKLNARGKIFACMYSIVAVLLVAFCIYNAVAISNIKNTLSQKEVEYAQELSDVNLLQKDYEEISFTQSTNQSNFVAVNESNTVKVKMEKRPKFASIDETTNWFDRVCEFISNLF